MAQYYFKEQKEARISPTITRMRSVTVFDLNGKEIGHTTMSKWECVNKYVSMLITEHETRKVWNSKCFDFNKPQNGLSIQQ